MSRLLSIIELGGYPDFKPLYQELGCEVVELSSIRKSISFLKKNPVDIVIAEFNFQSDFRDRSSSLESIMASIQGRNQSKVIIFLDKNHMEKFQRVNERFGFFGHLCFPIEAEQLKQLIQKAQNN